MSLIDMTCHDLIIHKTVFLTLARNTSTISTRNQWCCMTRTNVNSCYIPFFKRSILKRLRMNKLKTSTICTYSNLCMLGIITRYLVFLIVCSNMLGTYIIIIHGMLVDKTSTRQKLEQIQANGLFLSRQ